MQEHLCRNLFLEMMRDADNYSIVCKRCIAVGTCCQIRYRGTTVALHGPRRTHHQRIVSMLIRDARVNRDNVPRTPEAIALPKGIPYRDAFQASAETRRKAAQFRHVTRHA